MRVFFRDNDHGLVLQAVPDQFCVGWDGVRDGIDEANDGAALGFKPDEYGSRVPICGPVDLDCVSALTLAMDWNFGTGGLEHTLGSLEGR